MFLYFMDYDIDPGGSRGYAYGSSKKSFKNIYKYIMRQIFKSNLESYNRLIKNEPESEEALQAVLGWHLETAAGELKTDVATQQQVYELQKMKQVIMLELRQDLAKLDNTEDETEVKGGERPVSREGDHYVWHKGRDKKKLTLGELLTDGEWNDESGEINIKYHLANTVERGVRKQYLVEEAKRKLRNFLDQQIITNESASQLSDPKKVLAYQGLRSSRESGLDHRAAGQIAEKMVRNFLKKISLDLGADFEIIEADAYQDVVKKIDFIIHRKNGGRGVKVEEQKDNLGIQFTINDAKRVHKQEQVDRAKAHLKPEDEIDDIVLVAIHLDDITAKYNEWAKTKFAGGPDKLWSPKEKSDLFRGLLKGFLTTEEIEGYCAKFK
jgi:hypothetical protein